MVRAGIATFVTRAVRKSAPAFFCGLSGIWTGLEAGYATYFGGDSALFAEMVCEVDAGLGLEEEERSLRLRKGN